MLPGSKILLISYIFPPYPGIGGRRWAKHSIALAKKGHTVHVVCAKNAFSQDSLWTEEVNAQPGIIVHQLPAYYPKVLLSYDHNVFEKILYKFWLFLLPLVIKGTLYERTIFWRNSMLRKSRDIIKSNNIQYVCCTGGPFGPMFYATQLKQYFPNICLLNDLRDPWTWGPNWGFKELQPKRMAYEKRLERKMIEGSDIVSVPTKVMLEYLRNHYPEYKNKLVAIPHFFDSSELLRESKTASEKIRFMYYGTIYQDINHYLDKVVSFFACNNDKFTFDIFTDDKHHLPFLDKYSAENITSQPQKPMNELVRDFECYDYVLILSPDYGKDNISTKFYEILYTGTPIVLFSEKGEASEFLTRNHLGLHVDELTFETVVKELHANKNSFTFNSEFDLSPFELTAVTQKIEDLLSASLKN